MIREDYILTWIRRYVQWLVELAGWMKAGDHEAAARRMDTILRTLLGAGPDSVLRLTEGEILARLTLGDPPQLVREKCVILAVVLKHLATICAAQQRPETSRDCALKALQIVLGLRLRGEPPPLAEHLPALEELETLLRPHLLPPRTYAALTLFHEQTGRFDRAEDALFQMGDAAPQDPEVGEIGRAFYERLRILGDEVLRAGGLPRPEVEEGARAWADRYPRR